MAKTYLDIQRQIAKLQEDAQKARKSELADVIGKVRQLVAEYDLQPADIFDQGGRRGRRAASKPTPASARKTVGVAKYRDPKSGKTWTGRGKPPLWIAGKRDRSKFLIETQDGSAANGGGGGESPAAANVEGDSPSKRGKRSAASAPRRAGSRRQGPAEGTRPSAKASAGSDRAMGALPQSQPLPAQTSGDSPLRGSSGVVSETRYTVLPTQREDGPRDGESSERIQAAA